MIVETVRLSEKARNQLIQLKRKTGIKNWNVLCRWGLFLSLREDQPPPLEQIKIDSSIEMTWKTFVGSLDGPITAILRLKYEEQNKDGTFPDLPTYFQLQLHRGVSYLAACKHNSVADLYTL